MDLHLPSSAHELAVGVDRRPEKEDDDLDPKLEI
jgi:hypothetical protein